jgi:insertion element IS1 protein InsB
VLAIAQGTDQGDDIEPKLVLRQDEATLTLRPVRSAMVLTTRGLTAPDLQPQVDQTAERHHRALVVVAVAQPTSAARTAPLNRRQNLLVTGLPTRRCSGHHQSPIAIRPRRSTASQLCRSRKKTNKLWIWKAWDRASGRLVDWECGGRDAATLERLLGRVKRWNPRLYCTDDWAAYAELIPQGRLFVGKEETHGIERDHARQRHWLARFRRRSIVVSKAKRMVDASIALFARFGGNGKIGELTAMLA